MGISIREQIRQALSIKNMSVGTISIRTGLDNKVVARALHSMRKRSKQIGYIKEKGDSYGTYFLIPENLQVYKDHPIRDIGIKLAQLRSLKDEATKIGITVIDLIISDYEFLEKLK